MPLPNFWPVGSKIIRKPEQVTGILSREERTAEIAKIQATLREQSKVLQETEKKSLLTRLFNLMEEDEAEREGEFDMKEHLHTPSQEEKDKIYSVESRRAANDSIKEEDSRFIA